jgi:hypothetical protein
MRLCCHFLAVLISVAGTAIASADSPVRDYRIDVDNKGVVSVSRGGARAVYEPVFVVIRSQDDPLLSLSGFNSTPGEAFKGDNPENYPLPRWRVANSAASTELVEQAGVSVELRAISGRRLPNGGVAWTFEDEAAFSLEATMEPIRGAAPRISWKLTARESGWYTVGFTGGPSADPESARGFYQPLIWQELRFPRAAVISPESAGGLPLTIVETASGSNGLSADPRESPYRLPTIANARFGVRLRNRSGMAQPAVFAPLLGGVGSKLGPGDSTTFAIRVLLTTGSVYQAFSQTARDLFRFSDLRENAGQSLNATIESTVALAMDDAHSGWNADLKGFDYNTDVRGTVKVVSALHPLSLALIQDDPQIYRLRALPMTQYLMSRTKYLYNSLPEEAGQNAARDMRGPAAEVSELAELFAMSRGQSPVFRAYARALSGKPRQLNLLMVSRGDEFWDKLALYRLTREPTLLNEARARADQYIARRITKTPRDFADVHIENGGQFWSDFAPRWVDLYELWQETREPRYLEAAAAGARIYTSFAWFFPSVPAGNVTVDENDAPVGAYGWPADARRIRTPIQTVPAWQVSQIGLLPEAQTTYHLNPAVFLAHHAAYLLRIAGETNDSFLHDAARSAIVGRYKTYPGYDINVAFSAVSARADYPYRSFKEFNHNEVYYNHIWPQIALLTDYLLSDFEVRSRGAIAFPARYAQGYAYLRSKVYGDRPGRFMGDEGVHLWMPRGLVSTSDAQVNYVSGYGSGRFYLALANESATPRTVTVSIDKDRVPHVPGQDYSARLWVDGRPAGRAIFRDGRLTTRLTARGLTAIAVDDLPVFLRVHAGYFSGDTEPVSDSSYRTDPTPLGDMTAMMLSFGTEHRDLYVWTQASDAEVREVRLRYDTGGGPKKLVDRTHPFEFDVPLQTATTARYSAEFHKIDGTVVTTAEMRVSR